MKFFDKNAIQIHRILYSFANSIIKIFFPILIYSKTNNIYYSIAFIAMNLFMTGILNLILRKFLNKHPLISIILHIVPLIIIQIVFAFCKINIYIIITFAFLSAFAASLYSVPINLIFAVTDKKINVALFESSKIVGNVVFTILSAFVLGNAFKNSLIIMTIVSVALYVISILPLVLKYKILISSYKEQKPVSLIYVNKVNIRYNIFHTLFGCFSTIINEILPLYLFVNNLSIEKVSYIIAITETMKILTNYFSKFLVEKNKANISCLISCIVFGVSSILIPLVYNPKALFILSTIIGISFPLIFVPMFSDYIAMQKELGILYDGLIIRDFYVLTPRSFMLSIFFIIPSFPLIFYMGAATSVGMYLTSIKRKNKND